jgi:hypothetical protein
MALLSDSTQLGLQLSKWLSLVQQIVASVNKYV